MREILTIISFFSGCLVLLSGFFVFLKEPKKKLNLLFLLYCFSISIWLIFTSFMLQSNTDEAIIFWDKIVYLGVVFIPIFVYHFGAVFSEREKEIKNTIYLGYFLAFIFLILSRTNYFMSGIYKFSWGAHTKAGFFHHLFLIFFSVYIFLFFREIYGFFRKAKKEKDKIKQIQGKYLFLSFIGFAIGSYAFLPAYGIDINPLGAYLGGILAASLLFFAITKYHLFEIRVILTEIFVGVIGVVLLILPFLMETSQLKILTTTIFLFFCLFGYLLIRATHQEIKRREQLERLSSQLATANIKLGAAYKKLEKLDKAKSEFISIASHQLRTPLTAIKGYISMIQEKIYGKLPGKMKKPLENIYFSNERLIKLVNDILDVSRIEAGRMETKFETAAVEDIVISVIEELKNTAEEKNIYLKWERPQKPLPKISIDKDKIRQAIMNVVDNAIRYTEKGGVTIKLKIKNLKLKIIVSDTGVGLTKYELVKMFESFSRGGAGTRLYTEGVGLGLYIARKFVEMHKGKIWAKSEGEDKGSDFYIELPIKK